MATNPAGNNIAGATVSVAAVIPVPSDWLPVKQVTLAATSYASTAGVVALGEYVTVRAELTRLNISLLYGDIFTFEIPSTITAVAPPGTTLPGTATAVPSTMCTVDGVAVLSVSSAASVLYPDTRRRYSLRLAAAAAAAGASANVSAVYTVDCTPMLLPTHETGSLIDGYMSISTSTPSEQRALTNEEIGRAHV